MKLNGYIQTTSVLLITLLLSATSVISFADDVSKDYQCADFARMTLQLNKILDVDNPETEVVLLKKFSTNEALYKELDEAAKYAEDILSGRVACVGLELAKSYLDMIGICNALAVKFVANTVQFTTYEAQNKLYSTLKELIKNYTSTDSNGFKCTITAKEFAKDRVIR